MGISELVGYMRQVISILTYVIRRQMKKLSDLVFKGSKISTKVGVEC